MINSRAGNHGTILALVCCIASQTLAAQTLAAQVSERWPVHAPDRPPPPVVTPAPVTPPVPPPSDAIVLFDGRDLAQFQRTTGGEARWKVENGYVEVVGGSGSIRTVRAFGDVQLHIEWATPEVISGVGQGRGNSGIHFMGLYEVQVLDSYRNPTYPDGQAAALYGQYPPLVNASRPPGEWQTYDIFFRAPRFDAQGRLTSAARVSIIHNGVLVQDNVELSGPTGHYQRPPYQAHEARLPFALQDHGNPVRFRNIWLRELSDDRGR